MPLALEVRLVRVVEEIRRHGRHRRHVSHRRRVRYRRQRRRHRRRIRGHRRQHSRRRDGRRRRRGRRQRGRGRAPVPAAAGAAHVARGEVVVVVVGRRRVEVRAPGLGRVEHRAAFVVRVARRADLDVGVEARPLGSGRGDRDRRRGEAVGPAAAGAAHVARGEVVVVVVDRGRVEVRAPGLCDVEHRAALIERVARRVGVAVGAHRARGVRGRRRRDRGVEEVVRVRERVRRARLERAAHLDGVGDGPLLARRAHVRLALHALVARPLGFELLAGEPLRARRRVHLSSHLFEQRALAPDRHAPDAERELRLRGRGTAQEHVGDERARHDRA